LSKQPIKGCANNDFQSGNVSFCGRRSRFEARRMLQTSTERNPGQIDELRDPKRV
jgi:hypothetical protein